MQRQGEEMVEKMNTRSNDFALTPKAARRRSGIGIATLILFLWLLFACLLFLSRESLASAYFWTTFVGFAIMFSALALSGDPNPTPDERQMYPLKLSRGQHFVIGVVGMIVLAIFVIALNSPLEKDLRWDVFYGGTTGGLAAVALSGTYLEFISGRTRAN